MKVTITSFSYKREFPERIAARRNGIRAPKWYNIRTDKRWLNLE